MPEFTVATRRSVINSFVQGAQSRVKNKSGMCWMLLFALVGIAEGFVLNKTGIAYPHVLCDMFTFQNWVVMKMFCSACGVSMILQAIMNYVSPDTFQQSRTYAHDSFGMKRVVFGMTLVGIGMVLCGSGPTMFGPCLGAGVVAAQWIILGGIVGASAVAVFDKLGGSAKACPIVEFKDTTALEMYVRKYLGLDLSYTQLALAFGVCMIMGAVLLEFLVDYRSDIAPYLRAEEGVLEGAWPPTLAGVVIGLGQVITRFVTTAGMGGTRVLYNTVNCVSCENLAGQDPEPRKSTMALEVLYNYGFMLAGSLAAAHVWDGSPAPVGFSPLRSFLGGFMAIVGGLIAGGCTCGHGVSGTSELSVESFVAAGWVFASAIAAGYSIQALEQHGISF